MRIGKHKIHIISETPNHLVKYSGPKVKSYQVGRSRLQVIKIINNPKLLSSFVVISLMLSSLAGSYYAWVSGYISAEAAPQSIAGQVLGDSTQITNQNLPVIDAEQQTKDQATIDELLPLLISQNHREPSKEDLDRQVEKEKLQVYMAKWKSPFANDSDALDAFLNSNNMNLMIVISFVESSMGKKCYYNNCSGIGGYPPNLRKYASRAEWIKDFDSLLERRYKGIPIEKFMGLYVQPGSPNWINGVKQILLELDQAKIN